MTPAYRIVDGVAVPFPEAQGRPLVDLPAPDAAATFDPLTWTPQRLVSHRLRLGNAWRDAPEVLLYLPVGETPTNEHADAIRRALTDPRHTCPVCRVTPGTCPACMAIYKASMVRR